MRFNASAAMNSEILNKIRKRKNGRFSTTELIIALVAALTPLFILANEISGDEWGKASIGAIVAGVTMAVTQVIKAHAGKDD